MDLSQVLKVDSPPRAKRHSIPRISTRNDIGIGIEGHDKSHKGTQLRYGEGQLKSSLCSAQSGCSFGAVSAQHVTFFSSFVRPGSMHFSYSQNVLYIMHNTPVVLKRAVYSRNSFRLLEQSIVFKKEGKKTKMAK